MPENKDYFKPEDRYIRTISGRKFYLKSDDTSTIFLDDITHALSNMGRFTGHTKRFYSVAEHSVLVSSIVSTVTKDPRIILQALMHDASEAYLADISSPFKGALTNYRMYEDSVWGRISAKYGIRQVLYSQVKWADWVALFAEALTLQPDSEVHTWVNFDKYGEAAFAQIQKAGIPSLTHRQAEDLMHRLFRRYSKLCKLKQEAAHGNK